MQPVLLRSYSRLNVDFSLLFGLLAYQLMLYSESVVLLLETFFHEVLLVLNVLS